MQEEITPQVEEVEQVCQGFQGYQVPIVCGGNDVPVVLLELSERDIKESLLDFARARDHSSEYEHGA